MWRSSTIRAAHEAGFSLLEVLVAFSILGIALAVILQAVSGGMRNIALAEEYTRAAIFAESKLAAVGADTSLQPGEYTGKSDSGPMRWRIVIAPYQPQQRTAGARLYRVDVTVRWPSGGTTRSMQMTSLRLSDGDAGQ